MTWRRFEQDGIPGNFFEVMLDGAGYRVRYGPRGRHAREQRRARASAAVAEDEVAKLVSGHLDRGYFEIDGEGRDIAKAAQAATASIARDEQLEAACRAHPDDAEVHAVYADWLMQQGDPRGEIVARMRAGKLRDAVELIVTHVRIVCGVDRIPDCFDVKARHGFATWLATSSSTIAMFDSPFALFASGLGVQSDVGTTNRDVLDAIAGLQRRAELRELELAGASFTNGEVIALWEQLPALATLQVAFRSATTSVRREELPDLAKLDAGGSLAHYAELRAYRALPRARVERRDAAELAARCDRVRVAVGRIDAWLAANAPAVASNVKGPLDGAELATADIPDELRALWSIHGGQHHERNGYFGYYELVGTHRDPWLESTIGDLRSVRTVARGELTVDELDGDWTVFGMSSSSQMLALSSVSLRVVTLDAKDDDGCGPIATSLAEYLEDHADELEDGAFAYSDEDARLMET